IRSVEDKPRAIVPKQYCHESCRHQRCDRVSREHFEGLVKRHRQRWQRALFTRQPRRPRNPHASAVNQFRSASLDAVSEEDSKLIFKKLGTAAKAGEFPAIREVLDRVLGKPVSAQPAAREASEYSDVTLDRLSEKELRIWVQRVGKMN